MRKRQLFFAAFLGTAISTTAGAADLPTRKAPIAPAPAAPPFSWTGPYVGGFVGGNWAKVSPQDLAAPNRDPVLNSNGLTIGGLAGYNWGFNGFVIGGEVEAGYDHRSQSANFQVPVVGAGTRNVSDLGNAEGRARARLGYAWGNILFFGAGGLTVADLKLSYADLATGFNQQITHLREGFNVGGGAEWAFADHWTVRGEYIYDGFGARIYNYPAGNPIPGTTFAARSARMQESTARAVLVYKF